MNKTILAALAAMSMAVSGPALAASKKEDSCMHQAAVVAAVQQARLDRVKEREVPAAVKAKATWPESFNTAIPLVTPWVYEMKMRDVKKNDLSAAWKEMCLAQ
ncbi:MAG: hypothetical protein ABJP44_18735 [Sulfitobacter sp.]|jgi:hypothetical protein|uniref:hypothetical protein n=1 Tax=unclassified Sulfitobacter TaxID=196795 RepID=UPI0026323ABF|nr:MULTISPECIES: hypothetical protein [unclassified Sulfitobacter]WPZ28439.1 hypothetical protein T8A63_12415 [Sulfitobacter sp. OXR-159]|tara:strand:+ start:752 stop:1060 length:309 start_codon:yes stop_codon:yes gene_type:complete